MVKAQAPNVVIAYNYKSVWFRVAIGTIRSMKLVPLANGICLEEKTLSIFYGIQNVPLLPLYINIPRFDSPHPSKTRTGRSSYPRHLSCRCSWQRNHRLTSDNLGPNAGIRLWLCSLGNKQKTNPCLCPGFNIIRYFEWILVHKPDVVRSQIKTPSSLLSPSPMAKLTLEVPQSKSENMR